MSPQKFCITEQAGAVWSHVFTFEESCVAPLRHVQGGEIVLSMVYVNSLVSIVNVDHQHCAANVVPLEPLCVVEVSVGGLEVSRSIRARVGGVFFGGGGPDPTCPLSKASMSRITHQSSNDPLKRSWKSVT